MLTFITSQKGKKLLLHDGCTFSFNNTNKKGINWRCIDYHKNRCPGKIITDTDKKTGTF